MPRTISHCLAAGEPVAALTVSVKVPRCRHLTLAGTSTNKKLSFLLRWRLWMSGGRWWINRFNSGPLSSAIGITRGWISMCWFIYGKVMLKQNFPTMILGGLRTSQRHANKYACRPFSNKSHIQFARVTTESSKYIYAEQLEKDSRRANHQYWSLWNLINIRNGVPYLVILRIILRSDPW